MSKNRSYDSYRNLEGWKTEFFEIGYQRPPYMIAEIGLNHNGSVDQAMSLIDAACDSEASAAKFQIFNTDAFIAESGDIGNGPGSLRSFFRQFEFNEKQWQMLRDHCAERKVDFLASVFDAPSFDLYSRLSASSIKVASTDLASEYILARCNELGLPVILSTGASTEAEIERALSLLSGPVLLMECVSCYPARAADYNLDLLSSWGKRYGVLTGISDHTLDHEICVEAIRSSASACEIHFTLDKNLEGPDHSLSAIPAEFKMIAERCRLAASSQISEFSNDTAEIADESRKDFCEAEIPVRKGGRRSFYMTRDLRAGHILTENDCIPMRPGIEGAAASAPGKRLQNDRKCGDILYEKDVADEYRPEARREL